MAYQRALQALADPTRRSIFERLRKGPASVQALADALPVSRPAVSQHLKVLKGAGLVSERREGVRRIYGVELRGLVELRRYLDKFWDDALESFRAEAERDEKRPASVRKRLRPERGAKPPSESERGWGPASIRKRLRPERGAKRPSESERGWGPASTKKGKQRGR